MKIEKRDKLKAKIDKNNEDMKPTYDAYNKLEAEINSELAELEQRKRNAVYEHVMSVFGSDLSAEDFAKQFDRIMNDKHNKEFIERIRREHTEHFVSSEENIDAKISSGDSPSPEKNVPHDIKNIPDVSPASGNDHNKIVLR